MNRERETYLNSYAIRFLIKTNYFLAVVILILQISNGNVFTRQRREG